jgi:hypothetical protein
VNDPEEEPKRVENRPWKPRLGLIGTFVALHAAKSWDEEDREWIADRTGLYVPPESEHPHSEIFAVCKLIAVVDRIHDPRLRPGQRKWFFGPYGFLLDDFVALATPIACKGAQGLWDFGQRQKELRALRESYGEARSAGREIMSDRALPKNPTKKSGDRPPLISIS